MVMKQTQSKFTILIQKKPSIKSRQWWKKHLIKLYSILKSSPIKKKQGLAQQSTFTLVISTDKKVKKLNFQYRKINKPTDVLAFPLSQKWQKHSKYLGDVIISEDTAKRQAKMNNLPIESELLMLMIHGYLHLLGYNHIKKKDAKEMFNIQNKMLTKLLYHS